MGRLLRFLLFVCALAAPVPASAQLGGLAEWTPAPLSFTVLRDGSPIGTHRLSFTREGERVVVDIEIRFEVKLAFITLFRYAHDAREVWENGRLVAFDSRTNDDGTPFQVKARAAPEGLAVESTGGDYTAPADTVTSSYWHIDMIKHPRVLDSQSGRMIDLVATPTGTGEVPVAGTPVPARLFRLSGEISGELAYDAHDEWVKLSFGARGSQITYVRD